MLKIITEDELKTSKHFRDPYQTEKDYLQDIFLYYLYSKTANEFVFKGGTALSKFYYSDRFSEDLDFTLRRKGSALSYLNGLLTSSMADIDYEAEYLIKPEFNKFGTITAEITIKGPRYKGRESSLQHLTFEVNTGSELIRKPIVIARNPEYADARNYVAVVMDKTEIMAEKVRALMSPKRRHRERDLYDINFLLGKKTELDKKLLMKKLAEAGLTFSAEKLNESIGTISPTWKALVPLVQHRLEDYSKVAEYVKLELAPLVK